MKKVRSMFHYDGMTDLGALRSHAARCAKEGERVVLHLHGYVDDWDGCEGLSRMWFDDGRHELFGFGGVR